MTISYPASYQKEFIYNQNQNETYYATATHPLADGIEIYFESKGLEADGTTLKFPVSLHFIETANTGYEIGRLNLIASHAHYQAIAPALSFVELWNEFYNNSF